MAFFLAGVPFGDCVARDEMTLHGTRPGGFQEQLCTDGVRRAVRQRRCQRGCGYLLRPRLQGITEENLFPNHGVSHPVRILPILDASNAVLQACSGVDGVVNIQSVSGTEQGRVQHLDAVPGTILCQKRARLGPRQYLQMICALKPRFLLAATGNPTTLCLSKCCRLLTTHIPPTPNPLPTPRRSHPLASRHTTLHIPSTPHQTQAAPDLLCPRETLRARTVLFSMLSRETHHIRGTLPMSPCMSGSLPLSWATPFLPPWN